MTRRHCIRVAREPGKRALVSIVAARLLLVIESVVVCGHVLSASVVIFCVCAHYLDLGLWYVLGGYLVMSWVCGHVLGLCSFPGSWAVVMSWMGLWSSPGSVIISWLVVYGHILGGSVVIFWLRNHFLGRGLWSCPGSVVISWIVVCGYVLGLW